MLSSKNYKRNYEIVSERQTVGRSDHCLYTNVEAQVTLFQKLDRTHTKCSEWSVEILLDSAYGFSVTTNEDLDTTTVVLSGRGEFECGALLQALQRLLANAVLDSVPLVERPEGGENDQS